MRYRLMQAHFFACEMLIKKGEKNGPENGP